MIKYDELMKTLRKGQYDATAYLLCGDESYYIDLASQFIEQHVLDETAREMDQIVVYGKDLSGDDWGDIFAKAIGATHLRSKVGLSDVILDQMVIIYQ